MKIISKALAKGSMATIAAGALAMTSATPAIAQSYDRDDGIGVGEIIAGAVILGGIAVAAGAIGGGNDRYDDRRYQTRGYPTNGYQNNGYANQNNQRALIQRCVAAVENNARRYGYRYANVTQIRDVRDNRNGFRVRGDLVVDAQQGNRNARYRNQRAEQGRFNCQVDYRGQIQDINYNGIRGL